MSLTAAPEGWHDHLHRRRPLRGSSSITPHHTPPRALSASGASTSSLVAGGSRIICLANAQVPSRRSAARRRDKESVVPPAVFLSSVFRRTLLHQRLRRTRPSVPAPPGRETPSIYISVAPTATIPYLTDLLGGNHFRHHLSPLRGAPSSSAASNTDKEKRYRL